MLCTFKFVDHTFYLGHQIEVSSVFTHVRKFHLTYPIPTHGKDKNQTGTCWNTSDVIVTVNSEIFVRILFSRIVLKDILTMLKLRD